MINYYLITKPGIIVGNLITFAAGFLLASRGTIDPWLFISTLIGLTLIMASACIFNNYIDRPLDKKMERTKDRPLVTGLVSSFYALCLAICLGFTGFSFLYVYTNGLTVLISLLGFLDYVVLYSLWKSKTVYGTAIGSIAGAVPPVVGYCAVSNHFDLGAFLLFMTLVLWQMPHFFSIAVYHLEDYRAAGIPVLPLDKGIFRTKIHTILYIFAFITVAAMLTVFNYTGYLFLGVLLCSGGIWMGLSLIGFTAKDDRLWGRRMFHFSLVVITTLSLIIPLEFVA